MARLRVMTAVLAVGMGVVCPSGGGVADAQSPAGTVIIEVAEPSGSYATGFCLDPSMPVLGSPACSDGSSANIDFVNAGATATRALPAGTYNAGIAALSPLSSGGSGPVTVTAGETIVCTFAMTAAPSCVPAPPSGTATVIVTVDEASGSYATGFCLDPAQPVLGSTNCSDGSSANVDFLAAGATTIRSLVAGTYNAGVASVSPLGPGAFGPVTLPADSVMACTFSMIAAPSCVAFDGNGDGIDDGDQPHVTSVVAADGASLVTVAAPDDQHLVTDVVTLPLPAGPPPPGPMPLGLIGFDVTLPTGVTSADVEIHFPAGTGPTGYVKLRAGAWVDVTSSATIVGDVVTLHLVDNDALDSDPTVGVIGDPGGPVVADVPPSVDACKRGGWRQYADGAGNPIRNQGDCVSYVATRGRNPARG